jgi:hypothetical protein
MPIATAVAALLEGNVRKIGRTASRIGIADILRKVADDVKLSRDVRFTPESRNSSAPSSCPLGAKSRHGLDPR